MNNITTLILVAGKSSRFKSSKSKIFHELAGLPIIDHIYNKAKKRLVIVKNGDHSLSSVKNLKILLKELDGMIKFIN